LWNEKPTADYSQYQASQANARLLCDLRIIPAGTTLDKSQERNKPGSSKETGFLRKSFRKEEMTDLVYDNPQMKIKETIVIKTPEEAGTELGRKILDLIDTGGESLHEHPFVCGESIEHDRMHEAFVSVVGTSEEMDPDRPEVVRIGERSELVRRPDLGIGSDGLEQQIGWLYRVQRIEQV
jgi:hypothetical protein